MPWDSDIRAEVLEEFGTYMQSYDGGNVWLEQAEAYRQYDRGRKGSLTGQAAEENRQYERNRSGRFASAAQVQKATGKCVYYKCASPPEPGMTRCAAHREIHRLGNRYDPDAEALRRRNAAAKKKADGICLNCAEKAEAGRTRCKAHLEAHAANALKSYRRRMEKHMRV